MDLNLYQIGAKKIKDELLEFTNSSILVNALNYLYPSTSTPIGELQKLPWTVMLLIKWGITFKHAPKKPMHPQDFHRTLSAIHDLQVLVIDLDKEDPTLNLRSFIINQIWYQRLTQKEISEFTRLFHFMEEDTSDGKALRVMFKDEYGFDFKVFYIFARMISNHFNKERWAPISLSEFQLLICPIINPKDFSIFLNRFAVKAEEIDTFLNTYQREDTPLWEYFEETPFSKKPLLIKDGFLYVIHPNVLINGLCSSIPALLKERYKGKFKESFGSAQEKHIGIILSSMSTKILNESQIKNLYKNNTGKVVDYVALESSVIFIESKAIEPSSIVNISTDTGILNQNLKNSFIGAIHQAQECSTKLKGIELFNREQFLIVVTNREYFIPNGRYLADYINEALEDEINLKHGSIPIPLDNIFYISLQDFEGMLLLINEKNIQISDVLKCCRERHKTKITRRITMGEYIRNCFGKAIAKSELELLDIENLRRIFSIVCENENLRNQR